ncbi:MAG: ATP synthase F1 subunit epsilon [Verrucomicrobia bacterium CG_4_10_14_3_um_filter_43_23]|nr:MAG: ATP synthase F1 subunit epsilon [Verrucomicrobia bacterium CG1_02_43_26]PIP59288.1 MAG: ATP synthase F1 subunit epsilon [Verrucomicrobia bacterium CG22_combo_CG10-13_8_21_14_all_43_17]PIX57944.1 MAG: ATP synthase F1 subunit epsilon [Verrucomicrobia bacterium CG_4_10_14_3_um_filter_43_23]PIY61747.1 MAG: ATP synthase F1 subunit epsilon [Verrucomicrobia bacterium CG_4_10_14_0_8_um_filter_43_34]PJA43451.1 MAG: ATP synthase F1 subunit epsilon [Verrucomicrobia bacterium CG_4_9_14_3_um_filter_
MPIILEIVTPAGKIYSGDAETVILPTEMGDIGILEGHVPLLCNLVPGELVVHHNASKQYLAVDKGFARVLGNTVSVLTEAAIDVHEIDISLAVEAQARAEKALAEARKKPSTDAAEIERFESITRFAVAQQLVKKRH